MRKKSKAYQARGISLKLVGWLISIFAIIFSGLLVVSLQLISYEDDVVNKTYRNFLELQEASNDVQLASDYLTAEVRLFVVNADPKYMDAYFEEANITKRREKALETIHELSENTSKHEEIHGNIAAAVEESMNLMNLEYFAMKLICVQYDIPYDRYQVIANVDISNVAPEDRRDEALNAVLGQEYMRSKTIITNHVDAAIDVIKDLMQDSVDKSVSDLHGLITFQTIVIITFVVFTATTIIFMHVFIIAPMNTTINSLLKNEEVHVYSNREFNYMADTYNKIRAQNESVKEKLRYEAEHDRLTGLYNRSGYDSIYRRMKLNRTIYILLDIDKFKQVNDERGHEIGDKVLVRTASILSKYFNDENAYVFRIGGDEFSILIEQPETNMEEELIQRCKKINEVSSNVKGIIPGVTFSIGIAYGEEDDTTDTLFKKADDALYRVKKAGRHNVDIYE